MDELESLRAAAARLGSLAAGGRALGISRDKASKLVAALERRVGRRLFERSTRSLTLTRAGAAYAERVDRVLADLDAADRAVRDADVRPFGLLSVHAPLSWGVRVLIPLCAAFRAAFPEVHIDLSLDDRLVSPIPSDADVTIRIASGVAESAAVERLGEVRRTLYAAPGYVARYGALAGPEELAVRPCIHYAPLAFGESWLLEREGEVRRVAVRGVFAADVGLAILDAVEGEAGIGVLPDFLAGPALAAGRVVPVLGDWRCPTLTVYALTRPAMRNAPKVTAYLRFLRKALLAAPVTSRSATTKGGGER